MATASMMADLEEFVTCDICYNSFEGRDPRQLACCHAFCLNCIRDVYKTELKKQPGTDQVTCPKCQRVHIIPDREVDKLPSYFQASQVHDIMRRHKDGAKDVTEHDGGVFRMCMVCKKLESSAYCFSCVRMMCETCYSSHEQNKRFVEHTATKMTRRQVALRVCPHHEDLFEAYCTDCCKSVCKTCLLTDHNEHEITDFALGSTDFSEIEAEFTETKVQAEKNIAEADQVEKTVLACVRDLEATILERRDVLQRLINDQTETLCADLQLFKVDKHKELEGIRNENRAVHTSVQALEEDFQEYRRPFKDLEQVGLSNIQSLMESLHKHLPSVQSGVRVNTECTFIPVTKDITLGTIQYADPEKTPQAATALIDQQRTGAASGVLDCADSELDSSDIGAVGGNLADGAQIDIPLTVTRPAQLLWKVNTIQNVDSVDFLPNGSVIAAFGEMAHVYEAGVKTVPPFNCAGPVYSVCVDRKGRDVFIGTKNAVHLKRYNAKEATANWQSIELVLRDDKYSTSKNYPRCVADTTEGYLIYIDDCRYIQSIMSSAKRRCPISYDKDGSKCDKFKCYKIIVDSEGRLISTDCNEVSIHDIEFSSSDNTAELSNLRTLDTADTPNPGALCTDSQDNILVADAKKRAVLLFSPEGKLIREVVKLDAIPTDIALYDDKYLAVGTWDLWHNDRGVLSVYQVDLTVS